MGPILCLNIRKIFGAISIHRQIINTDSNSFMHGRCSSLEPWLPAFIKYTIRQGQNMQFLVNVKPVPPGWKHYISITYGYAIGQLIISIAHILHCKLICPLAVHIGHQTFNERICIFMVEVYSYNLTKQHEYEIKHLHSFVFSTGFAACVCAAWSQCLKSGFREK